MGLRLTAPRSRVARSPAGASGEPCQHPSIHTCHIHRPSFCRVLLCIPLLAPLVPYGPMCVLLKRWAIHLAAVLWFI